MLLDAIEMVRIKQAVNSILNRFGAFDDWRDFGNSMKRFAVWEFDLYGSEELSAASGETSA